MVRASRVDCFVLGAVCLTLVGGSGCTLLLDRERHHGVAPRDAGPRVDAQLPPSRDAGLDAAAPDAAIPCTTTADCGNAVFARCVSRGCEACEIEMSRVFRVPVGDSLILTSLESAVASVDGSLQLLLLARVQASAPGATGPYLATLALEDLESAALEPSPLTSLSALWARPLQAATFGSDGVQTVIGATGLRGDESFDVVVGPPRSAVMGELNELRLPLGERHPSTAIASPLRDIGGDRPRWFLIQDVPGASDRVVMLTSSEHRIGPDVGEVGALWVSETGAVILPEVGSRYVWDWTSAGSAIALPATFGVHQVGFEEGRILLGGLATDGELSLSLLDWGSGARALDPGATVQVATEAGLDASLLALGPAWMALLSRGLEETSIVLVPRASDLSAHRVPIAPLTSLGPGVVVMQQAGWRVGAGTLTRWRRPDGREAVVVAVYGVIGSVTTLEVRVITGCAS